MSKRIKKLPIFVPPFTLISYHRDKQGRPIGCIVAIRVGNGIRYGYSLCMKDDRKGFSKREALLRALNQTHNEGGCDIPRSMWKTFDRLQNRVMKYYPKTCLA